MTHAQDFAALLHINRLLANRPDKSIAHPSPVKHLAGVEGHCEIEIRRGNCRSFHGGSSSPLFDAKLGGEAAFVLASRDGARDPPCASAKFCHLRSTWTLGSASIAPFYFFILSSSSPSASTWAEKRKTSKTSRSAAAESRGGPCSPRSSPRKRARAHSSARRARASRSAITLICSSPSARSSRASWSATFSSNRTTITKFTRS